MTRHTRTFATSALLVPVVLGGLATVASAQQVNLTIKDGRVTLKTENASVRQVLDEWARVGQAKVVNAEKVSGPPLSLTLVDVPEREALETVLRNAAGYAVVERETVASNASVYDKILVMARTTPVSQSASAAPAPAPVAYQPPMVPDVAADEPVVDNEPPQPTAPVINPYANNGNAAMVGGGMNPGPNGVSTGTGNGAETRFDYANPQAYFERQRQQQQQQQPGQQPVANPYPGSGFNPPSSLQQQAPTQPTNVPSAGTTLSQPGIAPVPQPQAPPQSPQGSGAGFNPYNMNTPYIPSPANGAPPSSVEPDRGKYANPYNVRPPSSPQE